MANEPLPSGQSPSGPLLLDPVAHVVGGRDEPTLDYWGGVRALIRLDGARFEEHATRGLAEFSHLEVIFQFHLVDRSEAEAAPGLRRPRGNPDWPQVGVFGQRNMLRPNRLGLSRCRLLGVDGLDLHVEGLDAVSGTPILDIKPWVSQFGPRGPVREAAWSHELMAHYYEDERGAASGTDDG
jgi:tRNA (Thr-GGU) A37 N-methylase